jgi:HEAT repeat protein
VRLLKELGEPEALTDVAALVLNDPEDSVRTESGQAFAALAPKDPPRALALLEDLFRKFDPDRDRDILVAAASSLPVAAVVPAVERVWADADPARRSALSGVVLAVSPGGAPCAEALAFLVRRFDALPPDQRGDAIFRFRQALHEPAIELIGKALIDPAQGVREQAREAIHAFRQHREALEEFRRWQTGDAEARTSIAELMKLLESPNRDVVVGAVKALAAVRAKAALPALVKLLGREDPVLRQAVEDAIAKIGE